MLTCSKREVSDKWEKTFFLKFVATVQPMVKAMAQAHYWLSPSVNW